MVSVFRIVTVMRDFPENCVTPGRWLKGSGFDTLIAAYYWQDNEVKYSKTSTFSLFPYFAELSKWQLLTQWNIGFKNIKLYFIYFAFLRWYEKTHKQPYTGWF